jgi:hypothetical protein
VSAGYNNNVHLNTDRNGDGFCQAFYRAEAAYLDWPDCKPVLGLDGFVTEYFDFEDTDSYELAPYAGFDLKIAPVLTWRNRIIYDYFTYPGNETSDTQALKLSTALRHVITERCSHHLTYEWSDIDYPDRFTRLSNGQRDTNMKQEDNRHRLVHSITYKIDKTKFKLHNEFIINESNDDFQDYYDYKSYKIKPATVYYITPRLSLDAGVSAKYRFFDERRCTDDADEKVRETTLTYSASLYYDILKNVTAGITYTYTQNYSNDSDQEYSGSTVYSGMTYFF